ncbi:MAG: FAD-dependent oxidoreductase [Gammaproteobacteria bacterium]|nr:FAD-dependent oxidoreductase [Gammaproteobacteria bacterium]
MTSRAQVKNQQPLGYPGTWYASTLTDHRVRPKYRGPSKTEIVVIGAGLAGLTTALECLRVGKSVTVLEAKRIGWGASGRNGGFVVAGFAEEVTHLVKSVGLEKAQALYGYSRMGVEYVREQISLLDPTLMTGQGVIGVSRHLASADFDQERDFLRTYCDHEVEKWNPQKTRSVLNSQCYFDALSDPEGFHIHPLNYVRALGREVERLGGQIFENSRVDRLVLSTEIKKCWIGNEVISSNTVVLCTSAYDRQLVRAVAGAVLPVATHVAVTEPLTRKTNPILTGSAIADTRRAGDYYRMVDEGRLLWGGKITTRKRPPRRLAAEMKRSYCATYPSLQEVNVDYCWSGLMGYAVHKMPIIGELEPGLWVATAFGGHGLNTTAMAGCLVASAITDRDERWRDFSHFSAQWVGGPLGRVGVQASYWLMQLKDKMDERRSRMRLGNA